MQRNAGCLGLVAFAAALGFMAHATYLALRNHYTFPYYEDWLLLDSMFSEPFLPWLIDGMAGHRFPVSRLLFFLDYTLLSGHMHLLSVAAVACTWLTFSAARITVSSSRERDVWLPVLAFTGFALFWAGSCFDFAQTLNHTTQHSIMLLWVALAAAAIYQERRATGLHPGTGLLVVAALAAAGATFGVGHGFASWGALIAVALVARFPWNATATLAVTAMAVLAVYTRGLATVYEHPIDAYVKLLTHRFADVLRFVVGFVGIAPNVIAHGISGRSPYTLSREEVGLGFGVAGLAGLGAYAAWLGRRRERVSGTETMALGLMTFTVVGGLMVALNRVTVGFLTGQVRWVTYSTLFWIGGAWALGGLMSRTGARAHFLTILLTLVALCALPVLQRARLDHRARTIRLEQEAQMLLLGIRQEGMIRTPIRVYPEEMIERITQRLRKDRRVFFADPRAALPGAALAEHFASAGRCHGGVHRVHRLATVGEPAVQLAGFAWEEEVRAPPPSLVVVTDSSERIRGLGTVFLVKLDDDESRARRSVWWRGYLAGLRSDEHYFVHVVLGDGRSVCQAAELSGATLLEVPLAPPN